MGVAGRIKGRFARDEAEAVGMDGPRDKPLPNGMAWNMVFDKNAAPGNAPSVTHEQLWALLKFFLDELIPVAEEAASRSPAPNRVSSGSRSFTKS